jgi:formate dehydrogenase subunit beta
MGQFVTIKHDGDPKDAVRDFLKRLLKKNLIELLMVPTLQKHKNVVMQTVISDAKRLDNIDPFAPVVWTNAAKLLSSLSHKPSGHKIAALLRSCEIRAFIELVKLKQGSLENLVLISVDCLGRYENSDYLKRRAKDENLSINFLKNAPDDVVEACKACCDIIPSSIDLRIASICVDISKEIGIEARSEKGEELLKTLEFDSKDLPKEDALSKLEEARNAYRAELFEKSEKDVSDLDTLSDLVAGCINCYNCRVACPVCYCRECVFVTDTFRHDGEKYYNWAKKNGQVKMPTDTVFYHLTRMIHMSTLCVSCGQCTSACPNDIPLMEVFATTAKLSQKRFDYVPGRCVDEEQPLAAFHEDEFHDVTGQMK